MADRFVVIETVHGRTEAEIVRSFLRAKGVQCEISGEAVGWVYGFSAGPLAAMEILVPSRQGKKAREALKEFHLAKG